MARPAQDVTDTELAVLQILWGRGTATRREIADALYPGKGATQYTTVQKLLERLEEANCVQRERIDGALRFRATVGRDELISRRLQTVAAKLCEGSLTPLLFNLVKATHLTAGELQ